MALTRAGEDDYLEPSPANAGPHAGVGGHQRLPEVASLVTERDVGSGHGCAISADLRGHRLDAGQTRVVHIWMFGAMASTAPETVVATCVESALTCTDAECRGCILGTIPHLFRIMPTWTSSCLAKTTGGSG